MTRGYIAGPMHGYPDHNYPAFKAAAELLRAGNRTIVSPTDRVNHVPPAPSPTYHIAMLKDSVVDMLGCDHLYLLDNWEESRGVAVELMLACLFGYTMQRLVLQREGFYLYDFKFSLYNAVSHFIRVWALTQSQT